MTDPIIPPIARDFEYERYQMSKNGENPSPDFLREEAEYYFNYDGECERYQSLREYQGSLRSFAKYYGLSSEDPHTEIFFEYERRGRDKGMKDGSDDGYAEVKKCGAYDLICKLRDSRCFSSDIIEKMCNMANISYNDILGLKTTEEMLEGFRHEQRLTSREKTLNDFAQEYKKDPSDSFTQKVFQFWNNGREDGYDCGYTEGKGNNRLGKEYQVKIGLLAEYSIKEGIVGLCHVKKMAQIAEITYNDIDRLAKLYKQSQTPKNMSKTPKLPPMF